MADDFDRSFDFFQKKEVGHKNAKDAVFDPAWKDQPWGDQGNATADTSFDTNIFEFAASKSDGDAGDAGPDFFSEDPFFGQAASKAAAAENATSDESIPVNVAIHEQLSAMYDDFSQEGAISVTGSIVIQKSEKLYSPFCLQLTGASTNIQRIELQETTCEDISRNAHDQGIHPSDRVLRISLDPKDTKEERLIANYSCLTKLRPVPLLIKSRVRVSDQYARVGFKIRANPSNEGVMKNIAIMMAVPPDVDGENVKTSRKGGSWEELKRTLCWTVDQLEPGKALEIQAQFTLLEGGGANSRAPKFPVLVRCDYPSLFSSLSLSTDFKDNKSEDVRVNLKTSARILHRKV